MSSSAGVLATAAVGEVEELDMTTEGSSCGVPSLRIAMVWKVEVPPKESGGGEGRWGRIGEEEVLGTVLDTTRDDDF